MNKFDRFPELVDGARGTVRLIGADLAIGQTSDNNYCPVCEARHEQKLSVTRVEGGLLYNCYRAKCGFSGFVPDSGEWVRREEASTPVHKPYLGRVFNPDDEDLEFFMETWGVIVPGLRVTEDGRYAFPMFDPYGSRRGYVLRKPEWSGRVCPRKASGNFPKAQTYKDRDEYPGISWVSIPELKQDRVVLTEDMISAAKVSCAGYVGVSLNGTHLTYESLREIKSIQPIMVFIWLDPGAEKAAYNILSRWGLTFNFCCVITGDRDPKDYSVEEIKEKLGAVRW